MSAPPTLLTPLGHGVTRVRVGAVVPDAGDIVEIQVLSADPRISVFSVLHTQNAPAVADRVDMELPTPLAQKTFLWARQTVSGVDSGFGTPIEVLASSTALPRPIVPALIDAHAEALRVFGAVPGASVEIRSNGVVLATDIADPEGEGHLILSAPLLVGAQLTARVQVDGVFGLDGPAGTVHPPPLAREWPIPELGPCYESAEAVRVDNLLPGAKIVVEVWYDLVGYTEWAAGYAFGPTRWLRLIRPLVISPAQPAFVRVRQEFTGLASSEYAPFDRWGTVEVTAELPPAPRLVSPPLEGDTRVWIAGAWPGAVVEVEVAGTIAAHRAVADGSPLELLVTRPIQAGDTVIIRQGFPWPVAFAEGTATTAEPLPVQFPPYAGPSAPVVVPHVLASGCAIEVMRVAPGSDVEVRREGDWSLLGARRARYGEYAVDVTTPVLVLGDLVAARASRYGIGWSPYGASVPVAEGVLVQPEIISPVCAGDLSVLVAGVRPGSRLTLEWVGFGGAAKTLGSMCAAEPNARVPVSGVRFGVVRARVDADGRVRRSKPVLVVPDPTAPGPYATGTAAVSVNQAYFPIHPSTGDMRADLPGAPLVVLRHGDPPVLGTPYTHLGYAYLALHLASWGVYVVSVDGGDGGFPATSTAGASVLGVVVTWRTAPPPVGVVQLPPGYFGPVGLFGQSNGGAAVCNAEFESTSDDNIRAVSMYAPNGSAIADPAVLNLRAAFQVISGSLDQVGRDNNDWAAFERLPRPRYGVYVPRAWHSPPNTLWEDTSVHVPVGALDGETERAIVLEQVSAFMFKYLLGADAYEGRLDGSVPSRLDVDAGVVLDAVSVHGPESRVDRLFAGPLVIDNFSDAEPQLFLEPSFAAGQANPTVSSPIENTVGGITAWTGIDVSGPVTDIVGLSPFNLVPTYNYARVLWGYGSDVTYTTDVTPIGMSMFRGRRDKLALRGVREVDDPNRLFEAPINAIDGIAALIDPSGAQLVTRLGSVASFAPQDVGDSSTHPPPLAAVNTDWHAHASPTTIRLPLISFAAAAASPFDTRAATSVAVTSFSEDNVQFRLVSVEVIR